MCLRPLCSRHGIYAPWSRMSANAHIIMLLLEVYDESTLVVDQVKRDFSHADVPGNYVCTDTNA